MTTNILDGILKTYPKHLIGAAWLYHAENGELPTIAKLVKTYGRENTVGASETSRHDPAWMALWGCVKTTYTSPVGDALLGDRIALETIRVGLGGRIADLLADGKSIRETATMCGVSAMSVCRAMAALRKEFSVTRD